MAMGSRGPLEGMDRGVGLGTGGARRVPCPIVIDAEGVALASLRARREDDPDEPGRHADEHDRERRAGRASDVRVERPRPEAAEAAARSIGSPKRPILYVLPSFLSSAAGPSRHPWARRRAARKARKT